MLINELPDDCLLQVFLSMNLLTDLVNCSKVCDAWNRLVRKRMRQVRFFVALDLERYDTYSDLVYYIHEDQFNEPNLASLFPNLKVFEVSLNFKNTDNVISKFVGEVKSLKGLLGRWDLITPVLNSHKIEMLSTTIIPGSDGDLQPYIVEHGSSMKQLYLTNICLDQFVSNVHLFVNLERLSIHYGRMYRDVRFASGSILPKLKILELTLSGADDYVAFNFMDMCPELKSAHLDLGSMDFEINELIMNSNLEDLVLHFDILRYYFNYNLLWLEKVLKKYPNLKHLALRRFDYLEDRYIPKLIALLPNLVLIDLRGDKKITLTSVKYVAQYNERYRRSIKFYYSDGPFIFFDLPELQLQKKKISRGFNFMKHCFFKSGYQLSKILYPYDNN